MKINLLDSVINLFFPAFCIICGNTGEFLCPSCFEKIKIQDRQFCPVCYKETLSGEICYRCKGECHGQNIDCLLSVCKYDRSSPFPYLIHSFKYDFLKDLSKPLGELMCQTLFSLNFRQFNLCFVPLHKKRLKWRGFNQAELLANHIGKHFNLPVYDLLKRKHFNKPQMELSRDRRLENLKSSFVINHEGPDFNKIDKHVPVLLVDDVATTLSTLNYCADALKKNGFKKVCGIVLARVY